MIHLGDITQLHGDEIPVVDIITGGSPCQDLSVAGKRAGLDGERSGLFMEQIRIVKEMRERDRRTGRSAWLIRPRFTVWENVPGAFSSNGGRDFQAVLTEIVKIVEPESPNVPMPEGGRWSKSGCLYSDVGDWSIAWRVHDAQFWGVPQRRKRIALVADFGGLSAPEILFEREGLSGDFEPGEAEGQGTAAAAQGGFDSAIEEPPVDGWYKGTFYLGADTERDGTYPAVARSITRRYDGSPCIDRGPNIVMTSDAEPTESRTRCGADGASAYCLQGNGIDRADTAGCNGRGWREDLSYTLNTIDRPAVYAFDSLASNSMKSSNPHSGCRQVEVAKTLDCFDPNPSKNQGGIAIVQEPLCIEMTSTKNTIVEDGISPTLTARMGTVGNQVNAVHQSAGTNIYGSEVTPALVASAFKGPGNTQDGYCIAATSGAEPFTQSSFAQYEPVGALCARDYKGVGSQYVEEGKVIPTTQTVRRLTPLECERLQGYPDGWTDIGEWIDSNGKKHKEADSPRYKALGNSIALPFWQWMARRICAQYERTPTMGSLFDGIGGFPLVFQRSGAVPVWASEIEEFPIAVTKLHFPEERSIE